MPTITDNLRTWASHDWGQHGDEWSAPWGGARMQWAGTIFPRIQAFVPVDNILEIAPGHGRFTQFLLEHCRYLVGVDLAEACVEACRTRFTHHTDARFFVNDGHSLPMVADTAVDFAFSFDSLVHADTEAMHGYVHELSRILRQDGVAFLHHSNLGAYSEQLDLSAPQHNPHWRDTTFSADRMLEYCREAGLLCVAQELVEWGDVNGRLSDCLSVLTRPGSRFARDLCRRENRRFNEEAPRLASLAELFAIGRAARPSINQVVPSRPRWAWIKQHLRGGLPARHHQP